MAHKPRAKYVDIRRFTKIVSGLRPFESWYDDAVGLSTQAEETMDILEKLMLIVDAIIRQNEQTPERPTDFIQLLGSRLDKHFDSVITVFEHVNSLNNDINQSDYKLFTYIADDCVDIYHKLVETVVIV